jgi:hypothetical protein
MFYKGITIPEDVTHDLYIYYSSDKKKEVFKGSTSVYGCAPGTLVLGRMEFILLAEDIRFKHFTGHLWLTGNVAMNFLVYFTYENEKDIHIKNLQAFSRATHANTIKLYPENLAEFNENTAFVQFLKATLEQKLPVFLNPRSIEYI